ncbi:MAG: beta-hydroxyacyl-ACP dehydratase [Coriobacteriia bacterium]|nr:beta-hydroxyacyl-ACP dehydratase [Coriobacteriia bacterium]
MNREELKKLIPHREPMLLVDTVELCDGKAIGSYTVRGDEFFLQGHFPGNPVVPGVILCEMMAQASCLLIEESTEEATPYFTGMNQVKFKNTVMPHDTIVFKSELVRAKKPFYFMKGEGYVKDKLCVVGEFSFALVTNQA